MKNLLTAISAGRLNVTLPDAEYKLLLSNVRDNRDQKFGDFFYDTLERLLNELKSTTDNNDAAAFLKPVSRQEAPDYHEVIAHPMDLSTMSKKVKQRLYKTKRDFADDLSLIWDNCLRYNTGKDHYLRGCANRMRAKANKLLERISDRSERSNPAQIVSGVPAPPLKPNGLKVVLNIGAKKPKVPGTSSASPLARQTMTPPAQKPIVAAVHASTSSSVGQQVQRRAVPFQDRPAIERTVDTMKLFQELDAELTAYMVSRSVPGSLQGVSLAEKMRAVIEADERTIQSELMERPEDDDGALQETEPDGATPTPPARARSTNDELKAFMTVLEDDGRALKRKRSQSIVEESRKRPKVEESDTLLPAAFGQETLPTDPVDLWWELMKTDTMLGAGVPHISVSTSPARKVRNAAKKKAIVASKRALTKKKKESQSLLHLMNKNIITLKRVQRIHDKFAVLRDLTSDAPGGAPPPPPPIDVDEPIPDEEDATLKPWRSRTGQRTRNIDEVDATSCVKWMSTKVLQHEGFTGSSAVALDVLASVAGEFLSNVGRTLRFYCDKYSHTMTGEEILLHTLFESGTTQVSDLERYIKDDVIRYGGRLVELERKLENAYREMTAVAAEELGELDEDGEDLVFGNFPDELDGEDFFGFKALGLDKELGLRSLSVPTRLWNAKKRAQHAAQAGAGPKEPQLPFPPPPPFVPLKSAKIQDQIGILHKFYQEKAHKAAPPPLLPPAPPPIIPSTMTPYPPHPHVHVAPQSSLPLPPPPIPVPVYPSALGAAPLSSEFSLPSTSDIPFGGIPAPFQISAVPYPMAIVPGVPAAPAEPLPMAETIPDDEPDVIHSKLGPLGQIIVTGAGAGGGGGSKKKKADEKKDKAPKPEKEKKEPAPKGRPKKKKDPGPDGGSVNGVAATAASPLLHKGPPLPPPLAGQGMVMV